METSGEDRFLNREIQWLEFNRRVLNEAIDDRNPLLERLRFMAIFTSNLDEFVMKRVGGLKRHVHFGLAQKSIDGLSAAEQLVAIRINIEPMLKDMASLYKKEVLPKLSEHNIHLKKWKDLNKAQQKQATDYYKKNIYPVLTPLVVDNALPFPFISNLSLSLAIKLEHMESGEIFFGRVKIPEVFPPWVEVEAETGQWCFVSLLQIISHNLQDLFPDMKIRQVMPFRITRNADLDRDEEGAEDLLEMITEELRQRRFAEPVRLEVGKNSDPWMVDLLKEELELGSEDVYEVGGLLDYGSLLPIADLPFPHLKFKPWDPQIPGRLQDTQSSMFDIIKRGDLLVHHPYESFPSSVERFIRTAIEDPKVLAIKMTLYRTNAKSRIISALIKAAESGKQVVCLVELKARFDEERNIYWAQQMEKAGIHVVYGVIGFKTHCKTALVLRQEGENIVPYCHIGTGNYNSTTAKLYTDLGLFTSDPKITEDVVQLFHFLTGRSFHRTFETLLVAPMNMKAQFLKMIEREQRNAKAKKPAQIIAKFNSLEDSEICEALYKASSAGVPVDLIVRGFCCLRPGVPGLSENIRVMSVVGRFLEHSRLFYFRAGKDDELDGEMYIGSADWMRRNLHGRVEVITPIFKRELKRRCLEVLNVALNDQRKAWDLNSDGSYQQRKSKKEALGSQEELMKRTLLNQQLFEDLDNS
ncbi:MAG: polyphosphate kinase 1 [Bdellovibrionales bacterium]|nr:polyphosphate kinase 1 [Bdellovibrionales bacterium]